jgi:hypothetical protein
MLPFVQRIFQVSPSYLTNGVGMESGIFNAIETEEQGKKAVKLTYRRNEWFERQTIIIHVVPTIIIRTSYTRGESE